MTKEQTYREALELIVRSSEFQGVSDVTPFEWRQWAGQTARDALAGADTAEPTAGQWIRSDERLPEIGQRVLGHVAVKPYKSFEESCDGEPDCFVRVGDDRWANRNSNNYLGQHATVAWWMPCPPDPVDAVNRPTEPTVLVHQPTGPGMNYCRHHPNGRSMPCEECAVNRGAEP
jgi:hypothetical protein